MRIANKRKLNYGKIQIFNKNISVAANFPQFLKFNLLLIDLLKLKLT